MGGTDISAVYRLLKRHVKKYHVPVVDLVQIQTNDPFKVLAATILSARTKDKTTTEACKRLFSTVKKTQDLKKLTSGEIEKLIYPVGFYKNKAGYLKQLPLALKDRFDGKIPRTVEELTKLPGVGRKTANLVVAVAFKKPAVCVDTHVHKIMNRLGYVRTKTPEKTELALRRKLPVKYWTTFNSIFVAFGQHTCRPISPVCSKCPVKQYCRRRGVDVSR